MCRPLDHRNRRRLFDDAEDRTVAPRVATDVAAGILGEIAALDTGVNPGNDRRKGGGQSLGQNPFGALSDAGLTTVAFLDQTYFVLGLVSSWSAAALAERAGALKTLMIPGGLGSTHKVLILGKGVGTPALKGGSFRIRVT